MAYATAISRQTARGARRATRADSPSPGAEARSTGARPGAVTARGAAPSEKLRKSHDFVELKRATTLPMGLAGAMAAVPVSGHR
jgi:hypothetical protein